MEKYTYDPLKPSKREIEKLGNYFYLPDWQFETLIEHPKRISKFLAIKILKILCFVIENLSKKKPIRWYAEICTGCTSWPNASWTIVPEEKIFRFQGL